MSDNDFLEVDGTSFEAFVIAQALVMFYQHSKRMAGVANMVELEIPDKLAKDTLDYHLRIEDVCKKFLHSSVLTEIL